ncbi:hypothetical protein B0J13DRAFT_573651 [Dactylonectria estremocensis]|uniref:Secreted protein n=1 Tax=Dactylonectria estremocensis TaxID=1079267 RepID=A0A9P9D861_9HYPO|nr:hypothetical protein B0J13DRAFT_573651 [Dactylonectria estremocensis]
MCHCVFVYFFVYHRQICLAICSFAWPSNLSSIIDPDAPHGNFIRRGGYLKSQLASRRWCWGRQSHQPNKACATSGLLLPHRPYSQRPIKSPHILIHLLSQAAQLMLSTLTWLLGSVRAGNTHKMMPPRLRRRQGRWLYSATIVHGAVQGRLSP